MDMTLCYGLTDWMQCTACKLLCTSECPIEGQNVVGELAEKLKMLDSQVRGIDLDGSAVDLTGILNNND